MSLSGNFAEDKGIKVFFCVVFLLFLVNMRLLVLELFGPHVKSIFYDLPLDLSVETSLGWPGCFEKGERQDLFSPQRGHCF